MNVAHDLIRGGSYKTIALIGADTVSKHMDYSTAGRGTAIIFGDAAGAVILRATDDTTKGILAQSMHADGEGWKEIYVPELPRDFPQGTPVDPMPSIGLVQMNGSSVFKFAVGTFPELIAETLAKAISLPRTSICSSATSPTRASSPRPASASASPKRSCTSTSTAWATPSPRPCRWCFDELKKAGRVRDGQKVMSRAGDT
jgi:3-oxoacyl-[acyl-carrier-protein] synthase III